MLKTTVIDCGYVRPQKAASYLCTEKSASFVETGTSQAIPTMIRALKAEGFDANEVSAVFVTHVHLDHAGGASALMKACPNATLYAHPRASRHLVDPTKLVGSAKQVYGEKRFAELYGEIHAIPAARVRELADEESVDIDGTQFTSWHTRGHANHHYCLFAPATATLFSGDSFGVMYPALQRGKLFIFPSTSPTDFDPEAAIETVERIRARKPNRIYPTHFGGLEKVDEAASQLVQHLEFSATLLETMTHLSCSGEELQTWCLEKLKTYFRMYWENELGNSFDETFELWMKIDLGLNAAGIAHVAMKKRGSAL